MAVNFEVGSIDVEVRFDDTDGGGWVAEYSRGGVTIDDSQKVWHPMMPRSKYRNVKACAIARAYAKGIER